MNIFIGKIEVKEKLKPKKEKPQKENKIHHS